MKDKRISIVIQTYNEAKNIASCIENARLLTDSVIVVDTQSTDTTVATAQSMDVPVHTFPFARYVEPARTFGIAQAPTDWVLLLDADERLSPELITEIATVLKNPKHQSYRIPRKEFFAKKLWLHHGGWWPNYLIRLIHKPSFREWPKAIHSTPVIDGSEGYLEHAILHYSKNDYAEIVSKTTVFEDVESQLLFEADRTVSTATLFRKFAGELYRRLIAKHGYRDGAIGVIESFYQAFSKTITWIYLYEKKHCRSV